MENPLHRAGPSNRNRVASPSIKIVAQNSGDFWRWCQLVTIVGAMVLISMLTSNDFLPTYHHSFYLALRQTLAGSHPELHANSLTEK
jgi:hypothetical protein